VEWDGPVTSSRIELRLKPSQISIPWRRMQVGDLPAGATGDQEASPSRSMQPRSQPQPKGGDEYEAD